MKKNKMILFVLFAFSLVASGCVALVAGTAGGVGTATWLSGKLVQEVDYSMDRVIAASEKALQSLSYSVTKKVVKDDVSQIIAEYSDGRTIWIDIHKVLPATSRIEIRVGMTSEQEPARQILNQILKYL
ncbi:MAG: DUF3568 family protein [Candidatus Omnitrophica bacterium]|nr:DUF3568 family protein [Candidatus Omnitrophota bacterium]